MVHVGLRGPGELVCEVRVFDYSGLAADSEAARSQRTHRPLTRGRSAPAKHTFRTRSGVPRLAPAPLPPHGTITRTRNRHTHTGIHLFECRGRASSAEGAEERGGTGWGGGYEESALKGRLQCVAVLRPQTLPPVARQLGPLLAQQGNGSSGAAAAASEAPHGQGQGQGQVQGQDEGIGFVSSLALSQGPHVLLVAASSKVVER